MPVSTRALEDSSHVRNTLHSPHHVALGETTQDHFALSMYECTQYFNVHLLPSLYFMHKKIMASIFTCQSMQARRSLVAPS